MNDIYQVSLLDLIPANLRSDLQISAAAQTLDRELQAVSAAISETILIARMDELPEEVIDLLAWQWHVDFYEYGLPLDKKRVLVKNSIDWHRRKGTVDVVQEQVNNIFTNGVVKEWWEYGGEPYHFRVECMDNIQNKDSFDTLVRLIDTVKNVRSWLDSIRINRQAELKYYIGHAVRTGKSTTIKISDIVEVPKQELKNLYSFGCRVVSKETIRVVM